MNFFLLLCSVFVLLLPMPVAAAPKPLDIYFIDVEGGQATLVVNPSGQSILFDTGWPGFEGRDADRIAAVANAVGVQQIDYLVITHFHRDHVGGVAQLANRMKIGTFVDHGPNREDSAVTREDYAAYEKVVGKNSRRSLRPGDQIPLRDIQVRVLAADGQHISAALPGAGQPNPRCVSEPETSVDPTENARSLGVLITYGKFRFLDLGDLTKKKELELVCPNNLIGVVDLYLTTHHGGDTSNPKALVQELRPRVAVMNNGARKGGSPAAWEIIHNSPGLADLWQLHYAVEAGKDHNVPEAMIANVDEKCEGKYLKVSAQPNGTFTILNSRNKFEKAYPK
ncbi:MAG TPA: MBL fold metallo-hydrolase [Candidatus Dormibacteraeota bacterium]|nr:MBL fold metallo-hydrolase [Candidatus Dormibacteraeota bacterium]